MFYPQGVSSPDISQVNDAMPIPSFLLVFAFPAEGGEEEPHVAFAPVCLTVTTFGFYLWQLET